MRLILSNIRLLFVTLVILSAVPTFAQNDNFRLDNNLGVNSEVWRIEDEKTMVINGFDLTPTPLRLPAIIESITIDVSALGTNTTLVDAVVYEDSNGGSPVDARLVGTQSFSISRTGVFTAQFDRPVLIEAPVVWVGFYMPVGMEFRVDKQGSSVLTYWAWSPGTTFDARSLSNAQILGPGDGSEPVGLDLGGIARITAFAKTAPAGTSATQLSQPLSANRETLDDPEQAASYLTNYNDCPSLFYDTGDTNISLQNSIQPTCRVVEAWNSPDAPIGYTRYGRDFYNVYDITFYDNDGNVIVDLPIAITHCVAPPDGTQETSVLGVAYGAPRLWDLLDSETFGNLLCAEVRNGGNLAYFTPN